MTRSAEESKIPGGYLDPLAQAPRRRRLGRIAIVASLAASLGAYVLLQPRDRSDPDARRETTHVNAEAQRASRLTPEEEKQNRDELRKLAKEVSDLARSLETLPRGGETSSQKSAPSERLAKDAEATVARVDALIERYRSLPLGSGRIEQLREIATSSNLLALRSGDLRYLPFLEQVCLDSPLPEERRLAVIAVHGLPQGSAVDFLLAHLSSAAPEVRFYSAEGLAWVRGAEEGRARARLVRCLADEDPSVRRIVAQALAKVVRDPKYVENILMRIPEEPDEVALANLVRAVRELDPVRGVERVRALLPRLDGAKARLVEPLLAH